MSYPGSKAQAGVFQRIIGQMPPHSTYVEPFFGSGQVFWRKRRARSSILIDRVKTSALSAAENEPGATALKGNALELLPELTSGLPDDSVIYCDPPYLLSTRQGRLYYGENELSDHDHCLLLQHLRGLSCKVMVSGYPSALYSTILEDWRCLEYRTRTRGRTLTECLWCNFPEPELLHDWRYAGKSFRQRLAFNRLAKRYLARLARMAGRKRGFVLDAIEQQYFSNGLPGRSASADAEDLKSRLVSARITERRESREPVYTGKVFLGRLAVFTTQPRALPLQAMLDCQDWALRQGKTLKFYQDFI